MKSWDEFLTMGGYGAYVWPAYGVAALVLLWNAVSPAVRLRRQLAALKRRRGREEP